MRPAPSGRRHAPIAMAAGFEDGWLRFDSGAEKRRTAPIPVGWEDRAMEAGCDGYRAKPGEEARRFTSGQPSATQG